MPKGFFFLISAQFASGLADNALLILGIAFLHEQGFPGWWAPLLKFAFTLSYVFLAPVLGPLADAVSKSRLMATMNGLKFLAVSFFFSGLHPVLAFALGSGKRPAASTTIWGDTCPEKVGLYGEPGEPGA